MFRERWTGNMSQHEAKLEAEVLRRFGRSAYVGPPKAVRGYSVRELQRMGIAGIYEVSAA